MTCEGLVERRMRSETAEESNRVASWHTGAYIKNTNIAVACSSGQRAA